MYSNMHPKTYYCDIDSSSSDEYESSQKNEHSDCKNSVNCLFYYQEKKDGVSVLKRGTLHSAGLDLFSTEDVSIEPNGKTVVNTGVHVIIPYGCYGQILSRSGLARDFSVFVIGGVIDSDYTGELKILLVNHSDQSVFIEKSKAVAQLVLIKYNHAGLSEIETMKEYMKKHSIAYPSNGRGDNGFGSTNVEEKD